MEFRQRWEIAFSNRRETKAYPFQITSPSPDLINRETIFALAMKEFSNIEGIVTITEMKSTSEVVSI